MQTLVLAATTSKIVGVLSGAITTTQPDFTVHYADDTGSAFTEGEQDGTFNSTTQVDICTAPASSTRRVIKNITVYNRDTVSVTFTLKYSANATLRFITAVTLASGASWDFTPVGPTGATGATGSTGAAGAAGAYVLLEQHTASTSATLDFTAISSTYDTYVFEILNILAATSTANFVMRAATGAGPTYDSGSNYDWAAWVSNQAGGTAGIGSASDTSIQLAASLPTTATAPMIGTVKLYVPADTTAHKRFTLQTFYPQSSANVTQLHGGGTYKSATAVTAIRFLMSSGNITSGIIRMYGIAKT